MLFREVIRDAREKRNLSQEDVSRAIEKQYRIRLSPSYLSMIEKGTRTNLTVNLLGALLDFFNLPSYTVLSLFAIPALNNECCHETKKLYGLSPQREEMDALANLPEEARRSLEDYKEYLIIKYTGNKPKK